MRVEHVDRIYRTREPLPILARLTFQATRALLGDVRLNRGLLPPETPVRRLDPAARVALAQEHAWASNYDAALAVLENETIRSSDPYHRWAFMLLRSEVLSCLGRYDDALQGAMLAYRVASERGGLGGGPFWLALINRALVRADRNELDVADDSLAGIHDAPVAILRAAFRVLKGEVRAGRADFEQVASPPGGERAAYHFARAYYFAVIESPLRALAELELALADHPDWALQVLGRRPFAPYRELPEYQVLLRRYLPTPLSLAPPAPDKRALQSLESDLARTKQYWLQDINAETGRRVFGKLDTLEEVAGTLDGLEVADFMTLLGRDQRVRLTLRHLVGAPEDVVVGTVLASSARYAHMATTLRRQISDYLQEWSDDDALDWVLAELGPAGWHLCEATRRALAQAVRETCFALARALDAEIAAAADAGPSLRERLIGFGRMHAANQMFTRVYNLDILRDLAAPA